MEKGGLNLFLISQFKVPCIARSFAKHREWEAVYRISVTEFSHEGNCGLGTQHNHLVLLFGLAFSYFYHYTQL